MEQNISKIKQRILEFVKHKEFSKRKIYTDTGIANGVLDKRTGLTEDNIEKFISAYVEVNPTWLLTGRGSMIIEDLHLEKENWIKFENNYSSDKHSETSLLRVGLRLDEICNYKNIDYNKLADLLNISIIELSKMIAAKIPVSENVLNNINRLFPKINKSWLFTGKGSIEDKDNIQSYNLKTDYAISNQEIPLYNIEASAGLVELFQNTSDNTPIDTLKIPNLPKCDGAVFVTGDSMYPLLKSGDIVVYKEINDFKTEVFWGEMYLISVHVAGEEFISVKYIQKSEKGEQYIKLVSQNRHHQPKDVQLNKVRAMALIKASVRINSMG